MIYAGTVYDGNGEVVGGGISLVDGIIDEVLPLSYGGPAEVTGSIITPGLVDVHCHGGGGASFPDDVDPEAIQSAIDAHRANGTTGLVASLVSMIDPLPAIRALVPFCERGELAGIHMEGPFVSPHKAGAQNPAAIRDADLAELETWLEAGKGHIKTMTIAPETGNGVEATKMLLRYGARPSWGHTSTDGATTARMIDLASSYAKEIGFEGVAQTATHLFNAMPAINHREPGPIRELLQAARRGECIVELVADGVHVKPILVEDVVEYVEGNVVFVTDAIAAAGMPDGDYQLGGLAVTVADGAARLSGKDTIAGGSSRLAEQFALFASRGVLGIPSLVRACVGTPARALGLEGYSGVTTDFERGNRPSFVVFDDSYRAITVVRNGEPLATTR